MSPSAFAHRLDKEALVCDFIHNIKCKHCGVEDKYSYTEEEVRDTFFCGLYDKEILEKLCLIFKKRIPKLAEIVQEAESIESSRIMAARPMEGTIAAMSTYKKNIRTEQKRSAAQVSQLQRDWTHGQILQEREPPQKSQVHKLWQTQSP